MTCEAVVAARITPFMGSSWRVETTIVFGVCLVGSAISVVHCLTRCSLRLPSALSLGMNSLGVETCGCETGFGAGHVRGIPGLDWPCFLPLSPVLEPLISAVTCLCRCLVAGFCGSRLGRHTLASSRFPVVFSGGGASFLFGSRVRTSIRVSGYTKPQ